MVIRPVSAQDRAKFQSPAIPLTPVLMNRGRLYFPARPEIRLLGVDVAIIILLPTVCRSNDFMHSSRKGLSRYAHITNVWSEGRYIVFLFQLPYALFKKRLILGESFHLFIELCYN